MKNLLQLHEIHKTFRAPLTYTDLIGPRAKKKPPIKALEDVSFSVARGQSVAILGPNGAGKTTLLKIIATLTKPDRGKVRVHGFLAGRDDTNIKKHIGLAAFNERSFYWRLTGRQNLEFFASLYGLDKEATQRRLEELFDILEINDQNRRFDAYSTGLKQKFILMRSLLHNPALLLLDEPFRSLDYRTSLHLKAFIKEQLIGREKKTVLLATHQINEASQLCGSFIIMRRGRIRALGTLEKLRHQTKTPRATLEEIYIRHVS